MFKIRDRVLIKSLNKEGEIISGNTALNIYLVKTSSSTYWCDGDALEIINNKISYNDGQCILSWKLKDKNNLKLKIHSGRMVLGTLLKVLISEIDELKKFSYRRVSPYQIKWERPMNREDKQHVYKIIFMDVKDDNKIKESEILKLDCNLCLNEGKYDLFIPDLLEVERARGLVKLENDTYSFIESKFNKELDIKYLDDSMSRENLISNGWIVPDGYKEQESLYV